MCTYRIVLGGSHMRRWCAGTLAHGSGESQKLIDRPLIIGMEAVLAREHVTVRRDQKVGWQPERTTASPLQRLPKPLKSVPKPVQPSTQCITG